MAARAPGRRGCGSCRRAASSRPPPWCPPAGRRRCRPAPSRACRSPDGRRRRRPAAAPPRRARRRRRPPAVVSVVARRRPSPTTSASASASPSSPGNGGCAALTRSTATASMSQPIDLVAGAGDLGGERQADLAQRDDDRLQVATSTSNGRAVARAGERRLGDEDGLEALGQRDHRRVGVAGEQVAEGLELDQQRLAAGQRVARRVALRDAAQRLGVVPVRRHVAVLVEGQVGGEGVGHQHPALAQDPRLAHLGGREPVDDAVEADRVLEAPGGEHEVLVLAPHAVLGLGGHAARRARRRASARGRGRGSRGP